MTQSRIAILRSGDNAGVNFCRALAATGRYVTLGIDWTVPEHLASRADQTILEPALAQGGIDELNACLEKLEPDLVYVADTCPQLTLLSEHRSSIAGAVLLPDTEDHRRMEDKWETFRALDSQGIPVPRTTLPSDPAGLADFVARYGEVWLRRRAGSGGAGSLSTSSAELAIAWVDAADGWGEFTVAERLSDRSSTFSAVWRDGVLVASQLRDRLGWKYGEGTITGISGVTGVQRTRALDELHELATAAVRAVASAPRGIIGVDFTFGLDGRPYVTEVQPARFFSSIEFLAQAGLNLPDVFCRTALGAPVHGAPIINPLPPGWHWFKNVDQPPLMLTPDQAAAYGL